MAEEINNGRNDHDLLIEMATKLDRVIDDVKDLNKSVVNGNAEMQAKKLSRDDFQNWDRAFCRDYEKDIGELKKLINDNLKDHEKRIRRLEQWGFIAIGAITLLQIIIAVAR